MLFLLQKVKYDLNIALSDMPTLISPAGVKKICAGYVREELG